MKRKSIPITVISGNNIEKLCKSLGISKEQYENYRKYLTKQN